MKPADLKKKKAIQNRLSTTENDSAPEWKRPTGGAIPRPPEGTRMWRLGRPGREPADRGPEDLSVALSPRGQCRLPPGPRHQAWPSGDLEEAQEPLGGVTLGPNLSPRLVSGLRPGPALVKPTAQGSLPKRGLRAMAPGTACLSPRGP